MTNIQHDADSPKRASQGKSVLVIGRDHRVAEIVAAALPDWQLERAEDNEKALLMLQAQHFHLLLTGDETSGQQDVELLREVRRTRPHLRLIILTNESTPVDVIASMKERAFSYFSAP
jgi:DNA-binding NtrC family response regulator